MPMSNPGHVPAVLHYLVGLRPASLLDVGVGLGAYGFLARQYLDVAEGHLDPAQWRTRIDGVEVFEPYRNPVWQHFYDRVTVADVREGLADLPRYDLVLCNDVLEHVAREEARALVRALLGRCRVLIATTPASEFPQGAWSGNEAEAHLCLLSPADFPASTRVHRTGVTSLYVSWSDPEAGSQVARLARSAPRIAYPGPGLGERLRGRLGRLGHLARRAVGSEAHR